MQNYTKKERKKERKKNKKYNCRLPLIQSIII
jgi:hypothetical protein